jgi:outer membrane protein TolC
MKLKSSLFALAYLVAAAVQSTAAEEIDLASYLRRVEGNNQNLDIARNEVAQTEELKRQALAGLLPNAGLQAGYTHNLKDIEQPVASYATASSMPGVYPIAYTDQVVSYKNEFDVAAAVNFNVFDAASLSRYKQASEGLEARRTGYEYQRKAVMNGAKKLYYQALLMNEVVKVKEASEKIAKDGYDNAEAKFKAGLTTELEALMAEVAWKGKAPETAEAKRNREIVLLNFKQLAAIPSDTEISLTESLDEYPEPPSDIRFGEVLSARSDYTLLLQQKSLSELSIAVAKAGYLPTLSGSFAIASQRFGNDFAFDEYTPLAVQLGLKATLPLYTGGYREAKLAEERIGQAISGIRIAQKEESIKTELTSVELRLDEARSRIESVKSVVEIAQRAYERASTSFRSGVATQLQLNQANLGLEGSRLQYLSAVYDYLAAYFDWELAVGR